VIIKQVSTILNLPQWKTVDALRNATSYFDTDWNAFTQQKYGSMQWIPEQIVGIGEDDSCVRHVACTVSGCGFVTRYQNTSNLENHYITAGTDHKDLEDRLTTMQHTDRQDMLGSATDGSIALSRTFVASASTDEKKSRCDITFVKWLVRKNRALSMSKKDAKLNDFIDEVTDGSYNLAL
jgi:hypothetical protein